MSWVLAHFLNIQTHCIIVLPFKASSVLPTSPIFFKFIEMSLKKIISIKFSPGLLITRLTQ